MQKCWNITKVNAKMRNKHSFSYYLNLNLIFVTIRFLINVKFKLIRSYVFKNFWNEWRKPRAVLDVKDDVQWLSWFDWLHKNCSKSHFVFSAIFSQTSLYLCITDFLLCFPSTVSLQSQSPVDSSFRSDTQIPNKCNTVKSRKRSEQSQSNWLNCFFSNYKSFFFFFFANNNE